MSKSQRQMKLGAFFMIPGHHVAAWRHSEAEAQGVLDFKFYKKLAQTAERGKFDMVFLADGLAVWDRFGTGISHTVNARPEPLTLLSALSAVTEHIGLAATVSTTYNEPFHVARKFASLDHLSGGRAAWNVVTSSGENEAHNFSRDSHLLHEKRYERAREFVDVVRALWDSWEDGALLIDKESGLFADKDKVHYVNHKGEAFSVKGPLNIARPPQGHPVVIQAGSSEAGKELAAETAEVIFTAWQTLEEAQKFYSNVKGRMLQYGRTPDELKIMPGVFPIIGRTRAEAEAKAEQLKELIHPTAGVGLLSALISYDLTPYPVDGPLPELPDIRDINGGKSRFQLLKDLADREGLTIRGLYQRIAGARGHREILGTPAEIADQLEEWFVNGAADGFNIMPPTLPGGLDDFVELVIPELQRRGLFRTEYEGATLRENLGLARPASRFAAAPAVPQTQTS
ncbi:LLM class flavin-dependent oxidoreductase [Paenibacillus mucilaginosus]|uniref:YxeK3 n=2 Tax=Paenibacillus mucilaginosus TaxID=61624 RepID=H6NKP2_9BACL|nr:LLM class flavin-dependent oxidoreductase [Paenibacillus mucilaginosus]AEI45474.1 YxeK3 [Paenibacillus mucilaginosus KNP414]AFC33179.1 YxeK3 [Paenibacillus mucilaginosus 3016]MCG7215232.1 LLM class flavin-dependent oxidoreductase [Paenibacillus mucilaginosus]WDM26900.1 LLM class flavin-dependent oxidoreductase [Paenibacillus mucilaginosus]WFA21608.1 LLM class flavin-dependent oxidoreductase [Paenibacillus mucilaginosus]